MLFILLNSTVYSQGYNHGWLLGYGNWVDKGKINFTANSYQFLIEQRQIGFLDTQGNISALTGNLLMSSNGVYIANSSGNTMLNGSDLNPNSFTANWNNGLPLANGNLFLPWPDDTTKYVLFHQTGNYDPNYNYASRALFYSIIDMTGDNGNGEVIQKNSIIVQDTLGWGLSACKHANGRDWWIVALRDSGNVIYKILLTPSGIQSINTQNLPFPKYYGLASQPTFSPDGSKFSYTHGNGISGFWIHEVRLLKFDRCSGNFYNPLLIDISNNVSGFGVAFSPNSKYLYISKFDKIFQFNTDTTDISASIDTVAVYDGFISGLPPTCCATDFWLMYLAANGKIYLTSGSGTQHLHEMNYPDNGGLACDVQQHSIDLGIWQASSVPNHPNYYLGCDTTLGCTPCYVSVNEIEHDFKFNIYPNPSSGNFNIIYLLPQNKEGKLEVFDITGKVVYEMRLPQWSTLQQISLSAYINSGLYNCVITSDGNRVSKKVAIVKE
jgi:hypothetical protein